MIDKLKESPKIGLGTFPFGNVFSEISQDLAEEIVRTFIHLGGKYIETAPVYPRSKVILSDILKKLPRNSYFLSSKCVTDQDESGNKFRSGKREHIISQCENELKRLGVDFLDMMQSHIVAQDAPIKETAITLQYLKDNKYVDDIGVSNVNLEQLKEYCDYADVKFVQNRFSFLHQNTQKGLYDFCVQNNIFFNPYQVIERGLLTSQPTNGGNWRQGDLRHSKTEYSGEVYAFIRHWIEENLLLIANENNVSLEALIIAWTNYQPQTQLPVIGMTNLNQIEKLFESLKFSITSEMVKEINSKYELLVKTISDKFDSTIEKYRGV